MSLADAIASAPRRQISGRFWHQGPTRHPLTSCADPARGPGRYHRTGEPGVWYASSQEQAAWAELFRHFVDEGVDPFELRHRVGKVYVVLEVLDLTDESVRAHVGVDEPVTAFQHRDEVVDGLGGAVGHPGVMPGGELAGPADDGAAELADLGRARLVLQVAAEAGDELVGVVGVVDVVDGPDGLLGVPGGADLAVGVAGVQQAEELRASR